MVARKKITLCVYITLPHARLNEAPPRRTVIRVTITRTAFITTVLQQKKYQQITRVFKTCTLLLYARSNNITICAPVSLNNNFNWIRQNELRFCVECYTVQEYISVCEYDTLLACWALQKCSRFHTVICLKDETKYTDSRDKSLHGKHTWSDDGAANFRVGKHVLHY